jgi:hypothetical protein
MSMRAGVGATIAVLALLAMHGAGGAQAVDRFAVPATVSPEAAAGLDALYRLRAAPPAPDIMAAQIAARSQAMIATLGVTLADGAIGGVRVVRVRPARPRARG